jgi:hypothetical protein
MGKFTHPTSRRTIEVPRAGSARFWVEFNFAAWMIPLVQEDFGLLDWLLVRSAEEHFGVELAQGGRGVG